VLDWFSRQREGAHPLDFEARTRWFSEALLRSQFLPRYRGEQLAEGWTHADGVIGHVAIGDTALANATRTSAGTRLIVTEAKLFSRLSPRVTNAAYFDQAARNVACIAEVLFRARRPAAEMACVAFFVLAPRDQIAQKVFANELSLTSIEDKVRRRVSAYESADRDIKETWLQDWFLPTLKAIRIESLAWEDIISDIDARDAAFGTELLDFYKRCLEFNRLQEREAA
jgi:hypothetical protein